ncbi:MAG: hypothetical protein R3C11_13550 [Planctomycetaceae bacterium]
MIGFQQVLLKAVLLGTLFGCGLILLALLFGRWGLELAFGAEVAEHYGLLMALIALAPLKYGFRFFGNGLTATRQFGQVLQIQFVILFLLIALIFTLGFAGSMTGVAIAIYLSTLVRCILFVWKTREELRAIADCPENVRFLPASWQAARSLLADLQRVVHSGKSRWSSSSTLKQERVLGSHSELTSITSVKR